MPTDIEAEATRYAISQIVPQHLQEVKQHKEELNALRAELDSLKTIKAKANVDIKGQIVRSDPGKDDNYESGIKFHEMDEAALQLLKKYIKAFHEEYGSDPLVVT